MVDDATINENEYLLDAETSYFSANHCTSWQRRIIVTLFACSISSCTGFNEAKHLPLPVVTLELFNLIVTLVAYHESGISSKDRCIFSSDHPESDHIEESI